MEKLNCKTREECQAFVSRYNNMGDYFYDEDDLTEAETYYKKALEVAEQLSCETDIPENRRLLAITYAGLYKVCLEQEKIPDARNLCEKGLALQKQLVREAGAMEKDLKDWENLSDWYARIGDLFHTEGDFPRSFNCHAMAQAIHNALVQSTNAMEVRQRLAYNYERRGNFSWDDGELAEAREWYEKALEIRAEMIQETDTAKASLEMSDNYEAMSVIAHKLYDLCYGEHDLSEAMRWHDESLEYRKMIIRELGKHS